MERRGRTPGLLLCRPTDKHLLHFTIRYVDFLFEPLTEAHQWFMLAAKVSTSLSPPPPPPASIAWAKAATANICAGTVTDCKTVEECTSAFIGPCESAADGADGAYIRQSAHSVSFADEAKYLSCADAHSCKDMIMIQATGPGYRDLHSEQNYVGVMNGNVSGAAARTPGSSSPCAHPLMPAQRCMHSCSARSGACTSAWPAISTTAPTTS